MHQYTARINVTYNFIYKKYNVQKKISHAYINFTKFYIIFYKLYNCML